MTECCFQVPPQEKAGSQREWRCPQDGTAGRPVQEITLKSLLAPSALEQLDTTTAYGFCYSQDCPVVYFTEQGQTFTTSDLKVPVFQKDEDESVPVCYCFGWTRQRIRAELQQFRENRIIDAITAHIQARRCGCEVNNPQGYCCLENVRSVVKQIAAQLTR